MCEQDVLLPIANKLQKPVFRRDLHKKFFTEFSKVPKDWYPTLVDAVFNILGNEDAAEYFGTQHCVYCLNKSGGKVCKICPLDWQITVTDPSKHLCYQENSPLVRFMELESKDGADQLRAEARKNLLTTIANLPLSETAKYFDVVE